MLKTILAALGAVVAFGGLIFILAFLEYSYERKMERRMEPRNAGKEQNDAK